MLEIYLIFYKFIFKQHTIYYWAHIMWNFFSIKLSIFSIILNEFWINQKIFKGSIWKIYKLFKAILNFLLLDWLGYTDKIFNDVIKIYLPIILNKRN